jgi:hypothetical protein
MGLPRMADPGLASAVGLRSAASCCRPQKHTYTAVFETLYFPYSGISILGATASEENIRQFDDIIDDGNINAGSFRKTPNGRYTYILEE